MKKRKIAVFTGNRAEYGLLYPLLKAMQDSPAVELELLVAGAHLVKDFGSTLSEIKADGFKIAAEIQISLDRDILAATSIAIGSGILSLSKALADSKPDMLVVYADRFEGFSAVIAGSQMGIPVAHIEGGDVTEGGALDDSVRHAMTKLSHLHFTTNQQASNRILAMGEEDWRVHTVGFVDLDLIELGRITPAETLAQRYRLDLDKPVVVFTQHSVALDADKAAEQVRPSLAALEELVGDDVQIIVTYPNNDAGGLSIIAELDRWKGRVPGNVQIHPSLGQPNYHGLLSLARSNRCRVVCAGNSSSGIKETPALGCPAVNIGSRQDGRLRADNVIDVGYDSTAILAALRKCVFDEAFRAHCRAVENPYGSGRVGERILEVLLDTELGDRLLRKKMTLRGEARDGWYR